MAVWSRSTTYRYRHASISEIFRRLASTGVATTARGRQVALTMLADCLGNDERALRVWFECYWQIVMKLPQGGWRLSEVWVRETVLAIEAEKPIP